MPNHWFQFKQFRIEQDRCAMKVGTDGVILGAWADPGESKTALDIGTGTGLLALMIAQKSELLKIDAIEIDPSAASQAAENVNNSKFKGKIEIICHSFQDFLKKEISGHYDFIICNPPYFSTSKKGNGEQRNLARHDDQLSLEILVPGVKLLLSAEGKFNLILPYQSRLKLEQLLSNNQLYINRMMEVFPLPGRKPARICFEISKQYSDPVTEMLVIETGPRHSYSREFRVLTGPFYL